MSDAKAEAAALPEDIQALSFEDALKELEGIVRKLETGEAKLDEAITAYERGAALKRHCETRLRDAEAKIEKIMMSEQGTPKAVPAELD